MLVVLLLAVMGGIGAEKKESIAEKIMKKIGEKIFGDTI